MKAQNFDDLLRFLYTRITVCKEECKETDCWKCQLKYLENFAKDFKEILHLYRSVDIHKLKACQIFKVDYDHVTEEQRAYAKKVNYMNIYSDCTEDYINSIQKQNIFKEENNE